MGQHKKWCAYIYEESARQLVLLSNPYLIHLDQKPAYLELAEQVEELMQEQIYHLFCQPVSLTTYPDYSKYVFYPIDLSTITLRLRHLYYRSFKVHNFPRYVNSLILVRSPLISVQSLEQDIRYLSHNAVAFNGAHSSIAADAQTLTRALLSMLNDRGEGKNLLSSFMLDNTNPS